MQQPPPPRAAADEGEGDSRGGGKGHVGADARKAYLPARERQVNSIAIDAGGKGKGMEKAAQGDGEEGEEEMADSEVEGVQKSRSMSKHVAGASESGKSKGSVVRPRTGSGKRGGQAECMDKFETACWDCKRGEFAQKHRTRSRCRLGAKHTACDWRKDDRELGGKRDKEETQKQIPRRAGDESDDSGVRERESGSPAAADFVGEARAQVVNAAGDETTLPGFSGGRVGYKSRKVLGMPSVMATCMGMPNMEPETLAIHTRRESQTGLLAIATESHCTCMTSDTETAGKTSDAWGSSTSSKSTSIKVGDGLAALRKAIALSMAASGEDIEAQRRHHHLPTFEMDHGSSHLVTAQEGMQHQLQGGKWCPKPNQMQPWAELVGERVRVYWDGEGEWFAGHVSRYCPRKKQAPFFVQYDDGDAQWENLKLLRWMKDDNPPHARVQVATARILQFVFRKRLGKTIRLGPCQELITTQRQSALALDSLFQTLTIELRGLRAQNVPREVADIGGHQLLGQELIGRRLRMLWDAEREWFFGTVIRFCALVGHVIEWDDREVSVHDLRSEIFQWISEEESDDDARGHDVARGSSAGMSTNSKLRTGCCMQQSVRVRPATDQACVSANGAFPPTGLHPLGGGATHPILCAGSAICAVDSASKGRKRRYSTMVEAAADHVEETDESMAACLETYGHVSRALPPALCNATQGRVSMKSDRILVRTDMDEAIRLLGLVKKFVLQRKLEIFQQTHAGKASVSLFIYADALRQTPKCFTCCAIYLLGA